MKMTSSTIEALTEAEAMEICIEVVQVKGYTVYLADLGEYFGYSALVYAYDRHIKYANDYELHHRNKSREELRTMYLEKLNKTLYTEDELAEPLSDYHDFKRRFRYINELLPLRRDFISVFFIATTEEEKAARAAEKAAHPVFCHSAFGYFTAADADYAKHIDDLFETLCEQVEDAKNNYDYWFTAFYYEIGNHEYHINSYQGDWDTLSAFGNIPWRGQGAEAREAYFDDLGFTEVQRKAFRDARAKFLRDADENDWY